MRRMIHVNHWAALLTTALSIVCARADERHFTYSYEPDTPPQGEIEFEQWITLRSERSKSVGQDHYNLWEFRQELEYSVSDRYVVSLYLNTSHESFRDPTAGAGFSRFSFDGVSVENRYQVVNPADHSVGLTLYLEPRFSGGEAEVEERIILGQSYRRWVWALNLTHATEWRDNLHAAEGEVEASFGVARRLSKRWFLGAEIRDHNEVPDYARWENTAVFAGPVVSYHRRKWWAAFAVLPQVYGTNFLGQPHGSRALDLKGHERVNVRLLFGVEF
ncbi:MAG: DUF6662 family protein [Limisphaerales bacterium]